MSNMQVDSVLAQIRAMSSQVQGVKPQMSGAVQPLANGVSQPGARTEPGSFASVMRNAVDQVNSSQMRASQLASAFERGDPNIDLATVMLESQKASVSFRALTEVRNRFVNVYQEIMSMPI